MILNILVSCSERLVRFHDPRWFRVVNGSQDRVDSIMSRADGVTKSWGNVGLYGSGYGYIL